MKFFRIDLLTLLISLFILSSCKNPDNIGLPVDSSKALVTNLIDTATIIARTDTDNAVSTTNITHVPLAYFKDPIFGTTEANIVASLNLPSSGSAYTIPTGTITVDSAVLVLHYADGFYGDSLTTKYKVNVYQLNETIASKAYYNNRAWSYNSGTLLGTQTFLARPKTKVAVTNIVTGAKDTVARVLPHVRVPINTNFITTKFFGATASQLNNNSVFQNYMKGLYITLDKTLPGNGGNMFFTIAGDSTRIDVYYHTVTGSTIDTAVVSLGLGGPHVAQIKHDYSTGTAFSAINTQINNPANSYSTLYIQGLAGLRARIQFPYLKKMLATAQASGNDIVVNRAELVVTPVSGMALPPYVVLPRLTMYRNDIALQRQYIPDAYSGDLHYIAIGSFGGFYDTYHNAYRYIITGYIEDLMRGKLTDYGTYIAPTDTTGAATGTATIDITNSTLVGARAVLGGDKTSAYKMKLNIIYSKVTK
jgi:hypothetical protein